MKDLSLQPPPSSTNLPDVTTLPAAHLVRSLWHKFCRRVFGVDLRSGTHRGLRWSVAAVSDADGPAANVRNYREQKTLREILAVLGNDRKSGRACEIGCGYGRLTIALEEFFPRVVGFEREGHLLDVARPLAPAIDYRQVASLTAISDPDPFDFVLICTVLQHLTDDEARAVCAVTRNLAPHGHVLLIEKTEAIATTTNTDNGDQFISRARTLDTYASWMAPFELQEARPRILEPTYFNIRPGQCMLFRNPDTT